MKLLLVVILSLISIASANIYGLWEDSNGVANFGKVDFSGEATYSLQFPNFANASPSNSAMNNLTSIMTFLLESKGIEYLVTVNVAKNKVVYFVPLPSTVSPLGLRYDADVNSLKFCISTTNNSYLVGEIDPASGSYDVYGSVQGVYEGVGLSTWNHTYYVVTSTESAVTINMFDTRSGENLGSTDLNMPAGVTSGPYDLLYVPSLDVLVGTVIITDSTGSFSGQDYVLINTQTGDVKTLGIFTPQDQVNVVAQAAHQTTIYATVNYNANLKFVSINLESQTVLSSTPESTLIVSMGYFTNV